MALSPGFLKFDGSKWIIDDVEGGSGPTIVNSGVGSLDNIVSLEGATPASVIIFTSSSPMSVTGISGGTESRELEVFNNNGAAKLTLKHENVGSFVENRIVCPGGIDFVLSYQESVTLVYNNVDARWRVQSRGIPSGIANDVVGLDGVGGLINLGPLTASSSSITTANTTPTEFITFVSIPLNGVFMLEATVVMTRIGTPTKGGIYKRIAAYLIVSGTPTLIGSIVTPYADQETTAGDDVTIVINGTNIRVRVTAADTDQRQWLLEYNYKFVSA